MGAWFEGKITKIVPAPAEKTDKNVDVEQNNNNNNEKIIKDDNEKRTSNESDKENEGDSDKENKPSSDNVSENTPEDNKGVKNCKPSLGEENDDPFVYHVVFDG